MILLLIIHSLSVHNVLASSQFDKQCRDAGGSPTEITCECEITHWKINPYNSKCPEKDIALGAQNLPGLGAKLGQSVECLPENLFTAPKNVPDLDQCSAFKRDEEMPLLPENWALEFSGAQLLRDHPAVKTTNFENTRVGVVDTGLAVKDNPAAGAQMQLDSPELDYGSHGTHVAGIVASQKYGVNPNLRVKSFPTTGTGRSFEGVALMNTFAQAIDDPQVKVINVSIGSTSVDPQLAKLLNEAQSKGKWIVLAGGNEKSVNGNKMLGQEKLPGNLFVIGSMSYFAAPSDFSNFGPETDFYSPGSAIDSLNSGFVLDSKDHKPSIHYGGTSMATPHFAAVLATMRAIFPALDLELARYILSKTAILRGSAPDRTIKQANDYHAVHLLWSAKECLDKKQAQAKICLDQAEDQIQSTLKEPQMPSSSDCGTWEKYYSELKRNYFLTNGSSIYGKLIQNVLAAKKDPSWVDKIYLAPPDQIATVMKNYRVPGDSEPMKKEALAALDFYFPTEKPKALSELGMKLSTLAGKPENLNIFLELCSDYLSGAMPPETMPEKDRLNRMVDVRESCESFISVAPGPFMKALADRIRSEKIAINDNNTKNHIIVSYMYKQGTHEQKQVLELRDQLEHDIYSNILSDDKVKFNPNSYGSKFRAARDSLSLSEKIEFSKKYAALRAGHKCTQQNLEGKDVEGFCNYDSDILGFVSDKVFKNAIEKQKFFVLLDQRPAVGAAIYAFEQADAGFLKNEEALRQFETILKNPPAYPRTMMQDLFSERVVQFAENQTSATALAKILVKGDNLARLAKVTNASFVARKLIERVNDPGLRKKLIDVTVSSKSIYTDTKSMYVGADDPFQIALSSDTPEAKAKIEELMKKEQRDPWLENVRLQIMQSRLQDKPSADSIRVFVTEAKKHKFPFRAADFGTEVIASSNELMNHMEAELKTQKDGRKSEQYWEMVRFAKPDAYSKLLPILVRNFEYALRYPDLGSYSWVAEDFSDHKLPEPKLIEQMISTLEANIKPDLKYFDKTGNDSRYWIESYGRAINALSKTKVGRDYLELHPSAYEVWAKLVYTKQTGEGPASDRFSEPSPKFLEILRLMKKQPNSAPIVYYLYSRDPEAIDEALIAYQKLPDRREGERESVTDYEKRSIRESILTLVKKHPEVAKKVIDSELADNALRSDVMDLRASRIPKRKEIF